MEKVAGIKLHPWRFHAERHMPTPDEDHLPLPAAPGESPSDDDAVDAAESLPVAEGSSEVSMRLRLLGKLIIPPTSS